MSSPLFMGTYVKSLRQRIEERKLPKHAQIELSKISSESIAKDLLVLDDEYGILDPLSASIRMLDLVGQHNSILKALLLLEIYSKRTEKGDSRS